MPVPIPKGKQITIQKNIYPADYCMPSMEISTNHYDINYVISGDRKIITPMESYSYHSGNISMGEPYTYHRTMSESNIPYERYLVKFTLEAVKPFTDSVGKGMFDELYTNKLFYFSKEAQRKIEQMLYEMLSEYNKDKEYTQIILQGMLYRLLTTIYENKLNVGVTKHKTPLTEPILNAIYYIENNFSKKLTIKQVADSVHFSVAHFSRVFSSQLGMSFTEYLTNVRLNYAKRMLLHSNKSVMEIALDVGYCHGDYLSAQFKNKVGMTPMEYRYSGNT